MRDILACKMKLQSLQFPVRNVIIQDNGEDEDKCSWLYRSMIITNDFLNNRVTQPRGRWYSLGDQWVQLTVDSLVPESKTETGYTYDIEEGRLHEVKLIHEPSSSLTPQPDRVIRIENYEQASAFYDVYSIIFNTGQCTRDDQSNQVEANVKKYVDLESDENVKQGLIDWFRVIRDFAGIEFDLDITPGHKDWEENKKRPEVNWMDGNDIRSGCIWNSDAVRTFQMVQGPREGLTTWHEIFIGEDISKSSKDIVYNPIIKELTDLGLDQRFDSVAIKIRSEHIITRYQLQKEYQTLDKLTSIGEGLRMATDNLTWIRMPEVTDEAKYDTPSDLLLFSKVRDFRLSQLVAQAILGGIKSFYNLLYYAGKYCLIIHFWPSLIGSEADMNKFKEFIGKKGFFLFRHEQPFVKELTLWLSLLEENKDMSDSDLLDKYWKAVKEKEGEWY